MEKVETSSASLWLPYAIVVAVMAIGLTGGPGVAPTRPGIAEAGIGEPSREGQSIPARLWQDPLEATEAIRRKLNNLGPAEAQGAFPFERLIRNHTTIGGTRPDGTIDYFHLDGSHRVLFQLVSLPSEAYPEAGEQRVRARVAVVSALTTVGYRPANAGRLGVAFWDANSPAPVVTSQIGYPFEIFELDPERKVLFPKETFSRKFDEVIVLYVEEAALQSGRQFEWLKRLSRLLAAESPPERFARRSWVEARWLGPLTSDRLVALLRAVNREYVSGVTDLEPPEEKAVPITVLAVRPTIEPAFLTKIVGATLPSPGKVSLSDSRVQFATALTNMLRRIPLTQRCDESATPNSWLTLQRLGCDDALLSEALVKELTLRRPDLFRDKKEGSVVLMGEWDTLYGRALPASFAEKFEGAGGNPEALKRYTYLRGLDGQIVGVTEKARTEATKPAESADLFRQLLKSRAPSVSFGRTQVDYIDRLAARLRMLQRADPKKQHLEAVGILGSDPYDKLLILQGLRKEFPSVLYFTTELDASLSAPENYEVTHNLLVASGFDLRLNERYQRTILPFRDAWQASIYFATLYATEFFLMKQNQPTIGRPREEWPPTVMEIERSGPYILNDAPLASEKGPPHSPLPEPGRSARRSSLNWLVPLLAAAIVLISTATHFGRLAAARAIAVIARLERDFSTWLVILATIMFVGVACWIPQVASQPNEEPFYIAEGISSWPSTWLRALGIFLCACYFWIISWQFRQALANAGREFAHTAPEGYPPAQRVSPPIPCDELERFRERSRRWPMKLVIFLSWAAYVGIAWLVFHHLDLPAPVTRGTRSTLWEQWVLGVAVASINLLIVYAVVHNLSCSFFIRKVARWLRNPDPPDPDRQPLHTALMRAIGHVAGAMTQMIYYPFMLIFLLMAARHPLFDNFDWPVVLILVFSISSGVLLASTLILRRSADHARKHAVAWLERQIAGLKWQLAGGNEEVESELQPKGALDGKKEQATGSADAIDPELERRQLRQTQRERSRELDKGRLARAEWQLAQVNEIGGAALSVGLLSNPLLRAVLIPLGGTGLLQLMEVLGKIL